MTEDIRGGPGKGETRTNSKMAEERMNRRLNRDGCSHAKGLMRLNEKNYRNRYVGSVELFAFEGR